MKSDDHISALRRDADRMANGAEGRLDRMVPNCPGWQVADVAWHVGIVHMFWRTVASGALAGPEFWTEPDRPGNADLLAWFRDGADVTAAILEGLAPDTPAWTWGHRQDVGFIQRRVAQETTVHCWDAINAIGCDEPIPSRRRSDGHRIRSAATPVGPPLTRSGTGRRRHRRAATLPGPSSFLTEFAP
jgi:uncharacterized protein (TIGR03083 family)